MKRPNAQTNAEATKLVKVVLVGHGASTEPQKSVKGIKVPQCAELEIDRLTSSEE